MLNQFKKSNIKKYHILVLTILSTGLYTQDIESQYSIELNSNLSNQWWSVYNNYGLKNSKVKLTYDGDYQNEKVQYNITLSAFRDRVYIGESFINSRLTKNTYFKIGKYYRDFSSYLNNNLSSGSMLISHNAEPMPKIGFLSSYNYKNLDFNFGISHAAFEKSEIYTKAPMLHEKFVYLNYIKNDYEFGVGIVHEAMWGGGTAEQGNFSQSLSDFFKVFISADDKSETLGENSHYNALGNHLGIWDFYYIKNIKDKKIQFYYQHFFEDTSGLRFANRFDGLWGVELSNYIKNTNILFELLNTENQDRNPPYVNEKYYNHYQYEEGWSYKGYGLGNPFINYLNTNPSKIFHFGISSNQLESYNYKFLLSKKINTSDDLKYKLVIEKAINQFLLKIFIVGEQNMSNSIGVNLSYSL